MIWFGAADTGAAQLHSAAHFFWVDAVLHMGIFIPIKSLCENAD